VRLREYLSANAVKFLRNGLPSLCGARVMGVRTDCVKIRAQRSPLLNILANLCTHSCIKRHGLDIVSKALVTAVLSLLCFLSFICHKVFHRLYRNVRFLEKGLGSEWDVFILQFFVFYYSWKDSNNAEVLDRHNLNYLKDTEGEITSQIIGISGDHNLLVLVCTYCA
jgi:hypothetical protein